MIVCVTGSRHGPTHAQWQAFWRLLRVLYGMGARTLHHGCCRGLDEKAALIARDMAMRVVAHPGHLPSWTSDAAREASDELLPQKINHERNRELAALASRGGFLLAAPGGSEQALEQHRSGTWQTVRFGRTGAARTAIVMPAGEVQYSSNWDSDQARALEQAQLPF